MRFHADLDADYWAKGAAGYPSGGRVAAGRGRVQDVSREGLRLAIPQPPPAGERLELTLQVPGDNVPVYATGEVAWAAPPAGAGIRFLQIKPLDLARMLDYLYARWLGA